LSKRPIAVLAGVIAVAAIVAGCGSSSDESSDTTAALTKAEFIEQGDAICEKGNQSIEAGAEEFAEDNGIDTQKPTKAQQEEVIVEVVAPGVRRQGEEIADLGAPGGDGEIVEAIVAAVEDGSDELEENPSQLIEGQNPLAKGSKLAKAYGFEACGEE
jgi:hypothetical protein